MRTEINERTALAEIAQAVTSSTDIVDVFGLVAEQARQLLPFDYIAMWDRLQGASGFRVMAAVGAPSPSWGQSAVQPERSVPLTQILGTGGAVVTVMDPTDVLGHYDSGLGIEGMQTTLHIPLMWRGDLIGVLVIASKHASAFSPSQVRIADRLGSQVNGAFANAHLLRRVERNAQENATVAAVSSLLDSSKSLAEAYEHVANVLRSVVRFDYISFLLSDVAHGTVELLFSSGVPGARWVPRQSFPLAGSVTESVMKLNSGMLFYGDRIERTTHQHPGFELTSQPGDVTALALPLRAKNEPLGAVLVQVHGQVAYSQEDVALLRRVADQVAEAIMRRQLYLRAEREAMQQTALAELGASLTAAQDLASVLDIVTRGSQA